MGSINSERRLSCADIAGRRGSAVFHVITRQFFHDSAAVADAVRRPDCVELVRRPGGILSTKWLRRWLHLRFDVRSTRIRLQFGRGSTVGLPVVGCFVPA